MLINCVHGTVHGSKTREQNRPCTHKTWNLANSKFEFNSVVNYSVVNHSFSCESVITDRMHGRKRRNGKKGRGARVA